MVQVEVTSSAKALRQNRVCAYSVVTTLAVYPVIAKILFILSFKTYLGTGNREIATGELTS